MLSENRNHPRQRVFLKGRIQFNNGSSTLDCLVRDMSPTGARLVLTGTAVLPDRFDLYIPQKERTFKATLRWRHEDGIGINFEGAGETASSPPPAPAPETSTTFLLRRVSELEAENAVLRRMLADMSTPEVKTGAA